MEINVIMMLGGGGGVHDVALSALAGFSYDYTFLWLNKSRHASSICVKIFGDSCAKYYIDI